LFKRLINFSIMKLLFVAIVFSVFVSSCKKYDKTNDLEISVTTLPADNITYSSATITGNIENDDSDPVTEKGFCWGNLPNPTIEGVKIERGKGVGPFTAELDGLSDGVNYYVRTYLVNSKGVKYGNQVVFSTLSKPVQDIDGNVYSTVVIGKQVWMAENLRTSSYKNGNKIFFAKDESAWYSSEVGTYCYQCHEPEYDAVFGKLYNKYIAKSQDVCPTGWHLPSSQEWNQMLDYLGGENVAGGKMKKVATDLWLYTSDNATNSSGFSGLPGGHYVSVGSNTGCNVSNMTYSGYWWSSNNQVFELNGSRDNVRITTALPTYGYSIRCVRD